MTNDEASEARKRAASAISSASASFYQRHDGLGEPVGVRPRGAHQAGGTRGSRAEHPETVRTVADTALAVLPVPEGRKRAPQPGAARPTRSDVAPSRPHDPPDGVPGERPTASQGPRSMMIYCMEWTTRLAAPYDGFRRQADEGGNE